MKYVALAGLLLCGAIEAEPVVVHHVQGYIRGFLVLKDTDDGVLASGDLIQIPGGNRVTTTLVLHFAKAQGRWKDAVPLALA